MKNRKQKMLFIEHFKKTPIVEVVCNKTGVSRATFYRWKKDDSEFARQADEALSTGKHLISDLAESMLIQAIKNGDTRSIIFWLKHNKDEYRNRIELSGSIKQIREELTEDEVEILRQALKLAGFDDNNINEDKPKT